MNKVYASKEIVFHDIKTFGVYQYYHLKFELDKNVKDIEFRVAVKDNCDFLFSHITKEHSQLISEFDIKSYPSSVGKLIKESDNRIARKATKSQGAGHVLFGPYITLRAGVYKVKLKYKTSNSDNPSAAIALFDVFNGKEVFGSIELNAFNASDEVSITFNVDEPSSGIEFRLLTYGNSDVTVNGVSLSVIR